MRETMTVSVSKDEKKQLNSLVKLTGLSRSDVVRQAVREKYLRETLEILNRDVSSYAAQAGVFTDEDAFKLIS